ncbi:ligase-associated DNA damage response endonuclease PdeM [Janthinobacterium agaricidamnosum]|uniref:Calcineurin-like phosphoesterase family protein n=1 Tax=Janthinobacterium agaricidamnosum NBRC 102515 = DSM 9628 TaxID=1349767 RepID=W0V8P8_9BURK|nr:ligase-associated DNA damage response endonuclease PdeM [Janthinobacterium agaricidamnosum]CDG84261.1 calcineurin-like phosphoesterase family protein [Janthinobacterium agaricidamnosum NBRC 102515 = DSM 9628]
MKQILLAGETMLLLAQKALYWPRRKMLIVADIHFGKASAFRALGVPVPHGTTSDNLAGLDVLLAAHEVEHIVFLGDFLHSRAAHAPATLAAMLAWRHKHAGLRLTVVRGNHDVHAGDPAAGLNIDMADEPYQVVPFALCHHPQLESPLYVLAGHVHPVYRLSSRRDALRLPCFLIGRTRAVLPSFGAFTGGYLVKPQAGERIFLTADNMVFEAA